jgi:hypothetical protein
LQLQFRERIRGMNHLILALIRFLLLSRPLVAASAAPAPGKDAAHSGRDIVQRAIQAGRNRADASTRSLAAQARPIDRPPSVKHNAVDEIERVLGAGARDER